MKLLLKIAHAKPSMYTGSVVLNVLGMQFFRTLFFYLRREVRRPKSVPKAYEPYLKELEKNGIVLIPNFLTPEDFAKVKKEYDELSPNFVFVDDKEEIPLPHVEKLSLHDKKVSSFTKNLFLNNPLINAVGRAFLNRDYHLTLPADFTKIYVSDAEVALPKNGGTNNLHFDAPTRVYKAMFYITDANLQNGALMYCKGTQKRNTLRRLLFEYKLSIRYALNKWNPNHKGEYLSNEPWVRITPEEMQKNGLVESVTEGKANTLVLFNPGAFHRRGAFQSGGVRSTIEINFRDIETLRNDFYPLEKKLKSFFRRPRGGTPVPVMQHGGM